MKIRTGFVSNSSSANFIVGKSYKTVFDLAKAMLQIRGDNWENLIDVETPIIDEAIRDGRNPSMPMFFETATYDTYIKKIGGCYIVTTCNNHPFMQNLEGLISPPQFIETWLAENNYVTECDGPLPFTEFVDAWEFQSGEVFWSPKYDLEVSRYNYLKAQREGNKNAQAYCHNDDHFADMMVLSPSGKIICPVCYSRERDDQEPGIEDRFEILDL